MTKSAEAYFHEFRASADTDAAMSLLRSRDALLYLALMAAHLGEGQIRHLRPARRPPRNREQRRGIVTDHSCSSS
jgi:hypothetical protein